MSGALGGRVPSLADLRKILSATRVACTVRIPSFSLSAPLEASPHSKGLSTVSWLPEEPELLSTRLGEMADSFEA